MVDVGMTSRLIGCSDILTQAVKGRRDAVGVERFGGVQRVVNLQARDKTRRHAASDLGGFGEAAQRRVLRQGDKGGAKSGHGYRSNPHFRTEQKKRRSPNSDAGAQTVLSRDTNREQGRTADRRIKRRPYLENLFRTTETKVASSNLIINYAKTTHGCRAELPAFLLLRRCPKCARSHGCQARNEGSNHG